MSSIARLSPFLDGLSAGQARRARLSRKAKASSGLHAQVEEKAHLPRPVLRKKAGSDLDHSGTDDAVPFRNIAPHPNFVAQLLGQLLPDPEQSRSSEAALAYKQIALQLKLYDRIL